MNRPRKLTILLVGEPLAGKTAAAQILERELTQRGANVHIQDDQLWSEQAIGKLLDKPDLLKGLTVTIHTVRT
jgi:hypothetical protein